MQANNLLVTGDSRFLNEIKGKIDWTNILNKPTIPTVNNATLTIQKNGTNVQTFTANQSTNATANITVPTKVSELTNDSGYTTNTGTVTQVKVGSTAYNPTSGVISLPAYPSVPVTSVAGKTGAVTLTASDVGALASTTKYAGSSSAGGAATSAAKLTNTSKIGDTNKPVYFTANGVPTAISYTIEKSVPSTAVFTDANVTQTELEAGDSNSYELLLGSPGTATQTTGASKSQWLTYKPLDYELIVGDESTYSHTKIDYRSLTVYGAGDANTYMEVYHSDIYNAKTWDGTNEYLKDALAAKLSLSGGTMTGAITTATGKWYTAGNYVLHLNNSDIIGVNGLWFNDVSSDGGEGIMFPRNNGNWDDLYSIDGKLYYCVNRATAGARTSAYQILHTGNGVLNAGGTYTGGSKTAGYCMHGVGTGHTYACEWGSNLGFWVDLTKVATVSDRRLKDDIEPINMNLVNAIAECESYQYKAFNRGGNISVGIIAQDLVANCEKYGVDPLDYELIDMEEFIEGDPTLYYHIEYDQLLYFKTIYLENKIKELEAKLDSLT